MFYLRYAAQPGSPARPVLAPSDPAEAAWRWCQSTHDPADRALWIHVIRLAKCADSALDADSWFPGSAEAGRARQEAAGAIAVCMACPVRAQCLTLSLRHWDVGKYGVWGGMVAAERAALRRKARVRRDHPRA
jgi:hypothetical protein